MSLNDWPYEFSLLRTLLKSARGEMQPFWSKSFLRNSFYRLLARDTDRQRTTSNGKEQL